jgi:hypothetical protein
MPHVNDPGKYDELCTYVREQAEAGTVILIVLGGNKGHGFSVQTTLEDSRTFLPELLENVAADIRRTGKVNPDEHTPATTTS